MDEEGHQSNGSEYQIEAPKEDHDDEEDEKVLPSASTSLFLSPLPIRRDTHFTPDYEDWSNSPPFITTNHTNHYECVFLICFLWGIETRPKENPFLKLFAVCCLLFAVGLTGERSTKKKGRRRKTKYQIPKTKPWSNTKQHQSQ